MDEDDVIPGSVIPGGEVRDDFENFGNTVKILEYIAAGFDPYGPSGTANQEFRTIRAYLQQIYGPLPEGAEDYAASDLNGDGTNEVYAVDANGKPHTVYGYNDNNEVVSTSYDDFLKQGEDGTDGGDDGGLGELDPTADIRQILKDNGYSDEVINEIFRAEVKNDKFQGNNVLSNVLCEIGYSNCSDWSVTALGSTGDKCMNEDGEGTYQNGECVTNTSENSICYNIEEGVQVEGKRDSDGQCISLGSGDGDDDDSDTSCIVINQENADECGYEITSDGQLIPKDLSGAPEDYPNYDNCGNGVFVLEGTECPDVPITYSEEEQNIAEAIRDWVEGKIGKVKDMTVDDVLDVIFGGDAWDPQCKDEGDLSNCTGTDGTQGNKCWKDCVNISVLAGIPGLPMPPGAVDIGTVRDLENTANDIGTTIGNILNPDTTDKSFIQKVKDWVTGKIDGIFGNVDDVTLEDITGWITGKLGNVLGSLILIETADATNTVTTKINEILGLPLTDPEDENCIETEYFEANKEKCTALGYVDCDSEVGPNGEELAGGIKKGTISDCEVTGVSLSEEAELCKKTGRDYDDLNDKCLEECENPKYTILADGNCGIDDDTPLTPEQICEEKGLTHDPSDLNADPDGCVRVDPEVNPEQICEDKGLTYDPTAPEEDKDEDDCVSTVISDPRCNDPNAKNYNELGECGECESGFSKDPNTNECKPDGPTLDCTTITSENAAGCKKKDCGGGVFVDEGEDCPTTVNPCINGEEPDPQKGCPEDWCDEAMTIAPDENGQCPSDPPLVECPDGPDKGKMVTSLDECGTTPPLVECPDGPDKGKMVTSLDECGTTPPLVECPDGPDKGKMVTSLDECGTTTPYTCPDPNATVQQGGLTPGACGPCKTGYVYDGAVERCVQSTTPDPCLDAAYAAANPTECGTAKECNDCTCAEYAAANPEECATGPDTPSGGGGGGGGGSTGSSGMFDLESFEIAGDPQLLARTEFPIENFLQQYIDGPDNQDISITGLFEGFV